MGLRMDLSGVGQELASLDAHITDILRSLSNGFQQLEMIKDTNRQSRQLEEITGKMKECKRYASSLENKRVDLFDGVDGAVGLAEENILLASSMTNQHLIDKGLRLIKL